MSDTQYLTCDGGHRWSRPATNGRPPKFCPEHGTPRTPSPSDHPDQQRLRHHCGSDVTAAEVCQWVRSLGLDVHPTLKGRVADILVERYNREHPDRPYVRGAA